MDVSGMRHDLSGSSPILSDQLSATILIEERTGFHAPGGLDMIYRVSTEHADKFRAGWRDGFSQGTVFLCSFLFFFWMYSILLLQHGRLTTEYSCYWYCNWLTRPLQGRSSTTTHWSKLPRKDHELCLHWLVKIEHEILMQQRFRPPRSTQFWAHYPPVCSFAPNLQTRA